VVGFSRIELAQRVGLSEQSVARYERRGLLDGVRLDDGSYDQRAVELLARRRRKPGSGRVATPREGGKLECPAGAA